MLVDVEFSIWTSTLKFSVGDLRGAWTQGPSSAESAAAKLP